MGISSFVFFLLITLLAVYFIFILDYRNDVRQKANLSDFLFEFKMGHVLKHQRQLAKSTIHLAQELLMNVQSSSASRSFAKAMRALKMRSMVASDRKVTTIN